MKPLFYSILFLINFSLFAQSNQGELEKKSKPIEQNKGGCSIVFDDLSLQALLQTTSMPSIRISWNNKFRITSGHCTPVISQTLERQIGNNGYDTINFIRQGFSADTLYIDTSIQAGLTYNYRLTRKNHTTFTTDIHYSDTITLHTVGIAEEKTAISKIHPVPANDFLNFSTDQSVLGEPYQVINISGQIVMEGLIYSKKMKLNIQALPKGYYFLKVNGFVKKFVVNN